MTATALLVTLTVTSGAQLPANLAPGWLRSRSDTYQLLWPQRWSYFATPEGLTATVVYRPEAAGRGYTVAIPPLTSAQNLWGLSRRDYALLVEVASIDRRIPAESWRHCAASTVDGCAVALSAAPAAVLDNRRAWPALCGALVFAHERGRPVRPGAAASGREVVAVARVGLTCAT